MTVADLCDELPNFHGEHGEPHARQKADGRNATKLEAKVAKKTKELDPQLMILG